MSEAGTPVIHTRGLGKVYAPGTAAEVVALRGVDLDIERGAFVAIMGPSGSGKSTLMNLLGCLDTPSSGVYACDGTDEPTGALDSRTGEEILALFKQLREDDHTVILITHDPGVAAHADRTYEMHDGELHPAGQHATGQHASAEAP